MLPTEERPLQLGVRALEGAIVPVEPAARLRSRDQELTRPDLTEPLLFGPLLPPRYRFDGPGARPDAVDEFRAQLAASPRAAVDPADVEALRGFGLGHAIDLVLAARV